MATQVKRFNWVRLASGWEQFQSWQQRRKAMQQDFSAAQSTATSAFATAWSNQIQGGASLAAQAALSRIQAATAASVDKTA